MKRNKYILGFLTIIVVTFITPVITSCESFEVGKHGVTSDKRAEIEIWNIGPRSSEGYVIPYKSTNMIVFNVKIEPLNVIPDVTYYLALLSRSGYLHELTHVLWKDKDFAGSDPNERDVRKIKEAEGRAIRQEVMSASAVDKEIDPLIRDFNKFYGECREEAAKHGELQFRGLDGWNAGSFEPDESDIQRICNNYVEVRLLTYEECKSIEGAGF